MESNISYFTPNLTIAKVIDYFNLSDITIAKLNISNENKVPKMCLFDLYEVYKIKEKEQLMTYKLLAYIFGSLIVLTNSIVVVSSGLIIKKGQQPKSTYLLLGNVSLADTIIGLSLIFSATVDSSMSTQPFCIFKIGMLVCPALVSIFSVGLITVDRYIYLLHGLYHQRWFNTTRVRIGILCIWMIGVTLGFLPFSGWVNKELITMRCVYVTVFPDELLLFNSLLTFIPLIAVAILYTIILKRTLKNFRHIKAAAQPVSENTNPNEKPKLRICRSNGGNLRNKISVNYPLNNNANNIKRSASFDTNYGKGTSSIKPKISPLKAKSTDDLTTVKTNTFKDHFVDKNICDQIKVKRKKSEFSIYTLNSICSDRNINLSHITISNLKKSLKNKVSCKVAKSGKLRAVTIVALTSGNFIFSLTPYFVLVIVFVFCEQKLTNPQCMYLNTLLNGPVMTLGYMHSLLNPLIYAWWHKGFNASIRTYYTKYIRRHVCTSEL